MLGDDRWVRRLQVRQCKSYRDAVVTVQVDSLQCLTESLDPAEDMSRHIRMMSGSAGPASRQIMRDHRATARSLLSLRVLVQNRRKDKTPILVFGSRAQVLSLPSSTSAMRQGRTELNNIVMFTHNE